MTGAAGPVAVVVPCRNEARYLGGLLDALFAQTRLPDEVVIVDDGSTDGTLSLPLSGLDSVQTCRCVWSRAPAADRPPP